MSLRLLCYAVCVLLCQACAAAAQLDSRTDLYGDALRVRFLHRLRDERKFSSIDELKDQIKRDVARAEHFFARAGVKRKLAIV